MTSLDLPYSELGWFQLMELIRDGTFDAVYAAYDRERHLAVALKLPLARPGFSLEDVRQFLEEAREMAYLRHPSIIPVDSAGQIQGVPFLACSYVERSALLDRLRNNRFTLTEAIKLIRNLANTLHFAHESAGLVHGDINPGNVLLPAKYCGTDEPSPLLMAACFTKVTKTERTVTITFPVRRMTPFMSPEQYSDAAHRVDARSDVYSLGVLLHYLLTGETPGNALIHPDSQTAVPRKPDDYMVGQNSIPQNLMTVILKATAMDAGQRYQTPRALAEELSN